MSVRGNDLREGHPADADRSASTLTRLAGASMAGALALIAVHRGSAQCSGGEGVFVMTDRGVCLRPAQRLTPPMSGR